MNKKDNFKSKIFTMPDAFIIIFGIVALAAISTYFIPAGEYERNVVDDVTRVVPDSYSQIDSSPTNVIDFFTAIPTGMVEAANIIFMIFIIGGIVHLIDSTGAINSGVNSLIKLTKGRYMILLTTVSAIFGILASMGLASNAVIAFIPIGITLARALDLDAITGVATIYLGYYAGMIAGIFDPSILGLAQTIAELPLFSGMWLRIIIFIALIAIVITYTNLYAKKVKNTPEKSIMGANKFGSLPEPDDSLKDDSPLTPTQIAVLVTFVAFIGIFIYGAFNLGWAINELSAVFLIMGIVIACIARITPNKFISLFIDGAKSITYGALVVGLARAVIVILEDGSILDTIVYYALIPLESMPVHLGAQMLFLFNLLFNLLVTSGSGQAAIIMPLMVPLVDLLGITRQTGALILSLGDGFTNIITPTSGVLMAVLAVGGVSWIKWIKFAFPLLLMWIITGAIFIAIAVAINYGPF